MTRRSGATAELKGSSSKQKSGVNHQRCTLDDAAQHATEHLEIHHHIHVKLYIKALIKNLAHA